MRRQKIDWQFVAWLAEVRRLAPSLDQHLVYDVLRRCYEAGATPAQVVEQVLS